MTERRIFTSLGRSLVLRADVDESVLAWGATHVAEYAVRHLEGEVVDGTGMVLGGILCSFRAEGDAFVLHEPDLEAPHDPSVPDTYVPGITRALALAYEQHLVHASYPEAPPLRENLFHNMNVAVCSDWRSIPSFFAYRNASLGSHSGWSIYRGQKELEADRETSVREVIRHRPALARYLNWAPGTAVSWLVGFYDVYVDREDSMPRIYPANDSFIAQRLKDETPIRFDPIEHADFVEMMRAHPGDIYSVARRYSERTLRSSEVADALARDIKKYISADRLYDRAFIRKLRAYLPTRGDAVMLPEIEAMGALSREEAKEFLDRNRETIMAGKVPPRS